MKYKSENKVLFWVIISLMLAMFLILGTSCQKEQNENQKLIGRWQGTIEYRISGIYGLPTAVRKFSVHEVDYLHVIWADSPFVDGYTFMLNGEYNIDNITIPSETWCNGVHIKQELVFCGHGHYYSDDSLVESGIVYYKRNASDGFEISESGTWSAKFKKQK